MTGELHLPSVAVILPAAGTSSRYGAGRNKLLEPLCGVPVIARSLTPFLHMPEVRCVVVPTADEASVRDALASAMRSDRPPVVFCQGGPTRAHSVRNALARVPRDIEWLAVHDAARPLVSADLIRRTLAAAVEHGAAAPAVPVAATIKQTAAPPPAPVLRTIPRDTLWAMQTPQIMRRADLDEAFARCPVPLEHITDDMQLLELAGRTAWLVPGDESNIKITTTSDLRVAEILLK